MRDSRAVTGFAGTCCPRRTALSALPFGGRVVCRHVIEIEVQPQHVDSRLTQKSELAPLDPTLHELSYRALVEPSCLRDPGNLEHRGIGRDVGIEARRRRRDQIDRHVPPAWI